VIWSEGAIYNIGFERGLKEWREYLKIGGYIAVSEASWFTEERPAEIEKFWMDAYPGINTIPKQVEQMQDAGYLPVAMFMLPESCWSEHFFAPQVLAQEVFLKQHAGDKAAEGLIAYLRHEVDMYNRYKTYYGYTFFIGKKI
jgi:hypothetical protein